LWNTKHILNNKISPKERPSARSAPRAGAPAAQASPRPCDPLTNYNSFNPFDVTRKIFGPNTV